MGKGCWEFFFGGKIADILFFYSEEFLTGAQSLFLFNSISSTTDTGLY